MHSHYTIWQLEKCRQKIYISAFTVDAEVFQARMKIYTIFWESCCQYRSLQTP